MPQPRRVLAGRSTRRKVSEFLLVDELGKLVNVRIRGIRDCAVFHPLAAPVAPLIPLPETGRMNGRVRLSCRHNENVDDVLAAWIKQSSDILAAEYIET